MILKKGNINYVGDKDRLNSGESLQRGESLVSSSKKHKLILQNDGNLVLYAGFKFLWQSNTAGLGAEILTMQSDGNLTLKDTSGSVVWSTETSGSDYYLVMQGDGNLVLYAPGWSGRWSTGTSSNFPSFRRCIFKDQGKFLKGIESIKLFDSEEYFNGSTAIFLNEFDNPNWFNLLKKDGFSISFWFKFDNYTGDLTSFFGFFNDGSKTGIDTGIEGGLRSYLRNDNGYVSYFSEDLSNLNLGKWNFYNLAVRENEVELMINDEVHNGVFDLSFFVQPQYTPVIGARNSRGNLERYFKGWFSKFRIEKYAKNSEYYLGRYYSEMVGIFDSKVDLSVNQALETDQYLISDNGKYILTINNGSLKKIDIANNHTVIWEIETSDAVYLRLQSDGNLVFKNESGVTKWHCSTAGFTSQNFKVVLENNGDLNQYDGGVYVRTITSGYYIN